jgi:hypothetical protein
MSDTLRDDTPTAPDAMFYEVGTAPDAMFYEVGGEQRTSLLSDPAGAFAAVRPER